MFRKFDDGKVKMVVVVHIDDILAHAKDQATMKWFTAELGRKFKVKSMVETFGVETAIRIPASWGVPTFSNADEPQTTKENEDILESPYLEAVGALMWTTTMTRSNSACAVRAVAKFCVNFGLAHDKALLKVMHYLFTQRNESLRTTVSRAVDLA